jgi:hypothetical protein
MAYNSTANPPSRLDHGLLSQRNIRESTAIGQGGSEWSYSSTNTTTDIAASSFFSNAGELGMREGDVVIASCHTTASSTGMTLVIGMLRYTSTSAAALSTANGLISSTYS